MILLAGKISTAQAIVSCKSIKESVQIHKNQTWIAQDALHVKRTKASKAPIVGCRYAGYLNNKWQIKEKKWEKRASHYVLRDTKDWFQATATVQKIFPGTMEWLWNCSGAEGSHGEWVPYNSYGKKYYAGYEYTDSVGGWMQFRPSTFKGAFRLAYEYAKSKGYVIPLSPTDWINSNGTVQRAWFSPLGQALAAAYLHMTGSYRHHWSASIRNGCA